MNRDRPPEADIRVPSISGLLAQRASIVGRTRRRTAFALLEGGVIAALSSGLIAADRVRRIGVLSPTPPAANHDRLIQRMQTLGWAPGRNVEYIVQWGPPDQLAARAADLAALRPDLVLATNDNAVRAALTGIPRVPIVMSSSIDPIGLGWVSSLRRPGGRVTGTAWTQDTDIVTKYVELAVELVPGLRRLGAVFDPSFLGLARYRPPFDEAARRMGLSVRYVDVSSEDDITDAFETLRTSGMQAAFVFGSPTAFRYADRIGAASLASRLPAIGLYRQGTAAGMVLGYGPSLADLYVRTADYLDQILRGADPAELPVQQPTVYETTLNLRAASTLGLRVPRALLARADEVFE